MRTQYLKRLDYLALAPLLFVLGTGFYLVATQSRLFWVDVFFDDAYYYLGVARSIVQSGVSAFLPPMVTNGYQPLWLLLITAGAALFGTSDTSMALLLLSLILVFCLLFFAAAKRHYGIGWPAIFAILAFPYITLDGLETVMLPFFIITYFSATDWKKRGLFASLIFLSRLDALAIVVARDIYQIATQRKSPAADNQPLDFRHWRIIVPVAVLYFATNFQLFGIPVPVSGLAKSVGNHVGENLMPLAIYLQNMYRLLIVMGLLLALRKLYRLPLRFVRQQEIVCCLLAALMCAGYYTTMSGWPLWGWYLWPKLLLTFFLVFELIFLLFHARSAGPVMGFSKYLICAPVVYLLFAHTAVSGRLHKELALLDEAQHHVVVEDTFGRDNVRQIDQLLSQGLTRDTVIAMGDRSGSFGFFLGPPYQLFQTEGLVGSYDYLRALKADQGAAFLHRFPINYLIVERKQYLETPDVIGVAEPIQGLSTHVGPYLLCFAKQGILQDDRHDNGDRRRLLIRFGAEVPCPAELSAQFQQLRSQYGAIREFSLPGEQKDLAIYQFVVPKVRRLFKN